MAQQQQSKGGFTKKSDRKFDTKVQPYESNNNNNVTIDDATIEVVETGDVTFTDGNNSVTSLEEEIVAFGGIDSVFFDNLIANVEKIREETNNNIEAALIPIIGPAAASNYTLSKEQFNDLINLEIDLIKDQWDETAIFPWLVHTGFNKTAGEDTLGCFINITKQDYETFKEQNTPSTQVQVEVNGTKAAVMDYDLDYYYGTLEHRTEDLFFAAGEGGFGMPYLIREWLKFDINTSDRTNFETNIYHQGFSYKPYFNINNYSKYAVGNINSAMAALIATNPDWLVIRPQPLPSNVLSLNNTGAGTGALVEASISLQNNTYENPYAFMFTPYTEKYREIVKNHQLFDQIYDYMLQMKKKLDNTVIDVNLMPYFVSNQINAEFLVNYPEVYRDQIIERLNKWTGLLPNELSKKWKSKIYVSPYFKNPEFIDLKDFSKYYDGYTIISVGIPWGVEYYRNSFYVNIDTTNDDNTLDSRFENTITISYTGYNYYQQLIEKYLYYLRGLSVNVESLLQTDNYVNLNPLEPNYETTAELIEDPKKLTLMSNLVNPELYFQQTVFTSKYQKVIYLLVDLSEYENYTLTVEME